MHYGTYMNHAFWIMFFTPFRFMFSSCKVYNNSIKITTKCSKCLIRLVKPFVFLYDFIFKYKNSQALYQTAIFGDSFAEGGEKLYYLQMRNWDRFKPFKGKFIFFSFFSNVFVSTVASFVCYFVFVREKMLGKKTYLLGDDYGEINWSLTPPTVVWFTCFFVCRGYCSMVDIIHEATLYCFVADEEMYQGRQRFCEIPFRNFMDKYGKETEKAYLKHIVDTKRYGAGVGKDVNVKVNKALQKEHDEQINKLLEQREEDEENNGVFDDLAKPGKEAQGQPQTSELPFNGLKQPHTNADQFDVTLTDNAKADSLLLPEKGENLFVKSGIFEAVKNAEKSSKTLKTNKDDKKNDDTLNNTGDIKKNGDEKPKTGINFENLTKNVTALKVDKKFKDEGIKKSNIQLIIERQERQKEE